MAGSVWPLAEEARIYAGMNRMIWKGRPVRFYSLGDGAVTVRVGDAADPEVNTRMGNFANAVAEVGFPGFIESTAGYHTATVYYDAYELYRGLDRLSPEYPGLVSDGWESLQDAVVHVLKVIWGRLGESESERSRLLEIPVVYGGEWGPDLEEAAELCGLEPERFVSLHCGAEYRVYMIGFVPGFPYFGGLPKELAVPRRDTPRLSVPVGSVAVGGGQTGIYPFTVPGGWRLIGRTPLQLFDPDRGEPSLLRAGDRVRFVPISATDWPEDGR